MGKGRLEAFTDGVIAIIITIMVLEFKVPAGPELGALRSLVPVFMSYALSFVFIGIYWSNHHHLFQAAQHVNGRVLWANLHLLFWLSLTPLVTAWLGANFGSAWPAAAYGGVLLLSAVAYYILAQSLIAHHGRQSKLALAIGGDFKGKVSIGIYAAAIALAFVNPWLSAGGYVLVALMWLCPDQRIEKMLAAEDLEHPR